MNTLTTTDSDQNTRLLGLESRISMLESKLASLIAEIRTLQNVGKVLATGIGIALGIDVLPMVGGA